MSCFRKKGWFCQNLLKFCGLKPIYGVKFEIKSHKNPCLGGEFYIMTKMCLGVNFKTFVHAWVHLHVWVVPLGTMCSCSEILNWQLLACCRTLQIECSKQQNGCGKVKALALKCIRGSTWTHYFIFLHLLFKWVKIFLPVFFFFFFL